MKWWKRKLKGEPRLTDDQFNAALDQHLQCIRAIFSDRKTDFIPMAVVIRASAKDLHVFANENEVEALDLNNLTNEFARSAREEQAVPQAIMFAYLAEAQDGEECIVLHGAAPDDRANAAILDLTRDSQGFLQSGGCDVRYYPAQEGAMPKLNYAKEILNVWSE